MDTRSRYSTERIGEPQTVLVVDDDTVIRSFEALLLSNGGYKVLQASSASEALRLADNAPVDLLLTDFLMPEVDGIELALRFRTMHPETPVLMVSGSLPPTDNRIAKFARFDFLSKPFEFEELLQKVRTLIDTETPFPLRAA